MTLKVSETNAEDTHGNTIIRPGDKVKYKGRWSRVIEVYSNPKRLKIYQTAALHSSIEKIHPESVTGFQGRDSDD